MDLDEAFDAVGNLGKGQLKMFMPAYISCLLYTPLLVLSSVFNQYELKEIKSINETTNATITTLEDPPPFYSFNIEYPDIPLVQIHTITSFFMAGVAIGSLLGGLLSDRYGRQKMLFLTCSMAMISMGLSGILTYGFKSYAFWRFLTGFWRGAFNQSMISLIYETVGSKKYRFLMLTGASFWIFGSFFAPLYALIFQKWRQYSVFLGVAHVWTLAIVWRTPETPRWLYTKGRVAEAETILKEIGRLNGKSSDDLAKVRLKASEEFNLNDVAAEPEGLRDLLRSFAVMVRVVVVSFVLFTLSMVYYGVTYGIGHFGSNVYTSMMWSSLTEIPSPLLVFFLLNNSLFGRRGTLFSFLIFTGANALLLDIFQFQGNAKLALALATKMLIGCCWSAIDMYQNELFPSSVRGACNGIGGACAQAAGIFAPFAMDLGQMLRPGDEDSPFLMYGVMCITSVLLGLALPETYKKRTFDTIKELEEFRAAERAAFSHDHWFWKWFDKEEDQIVLTQGEEEFH